jgi:hypothetical protein
MVKNKSKRSKTKPFAPWGDPPRFIAIAPPPTTETIRLDLGCGPHKREGFIGVDSIAFPGVDVVLNVVDPIYAPIPTGTDLWFESAFERKIIGYKSWPWAENSVEEAHASHFLEHLQKKERWHFFNELYRVLKPGAKVTIITPDWCSQRAYGDMTHEWPAVAGFFWFYLSKEWRAVNAPHNDAQRVKGGLSCNFGATWGPTLHPDLVNRNQEYQQHAINFWKEASQDMVCTLTKA